MNKIRLDIVVPTVRLTIERMLMIADIKIPKGLQVHFYFVIDNPEVKDIAFEDCIQDKSITIIRNGSNIGAHLSRNRGFEAGIGEYVLFLDDDIEVSRNLLETYSEPIRNHPSSPGFVGTVKFPSCSNSFTKAAVASDILTFWDIAEKAPRLAWGITANLLVKRAAVSDIRFSSKFPKKGGGEDVDYCLRIVKKSGMWLISVPDATVIHPWWNQGSQQYGRFARWAYGDSSLPTLHSEHKFRNAPNMIETVFVMALLAIFCFIFLNMTLLWFSAWLGIVFLVELFMDGFRMRIVGKNQTLIVSVQATLIRLANDIGRLAGHIKHLHLQGITERFDYFMTGNHIGYERRVSFSKFIAYISLAMGVFIILN